MTQKHLKIWLQQHLFGKKKTDKKLQTWPMFQGSKEVWENLWNIFLLLNENI